jgi:glycine cleavage system aminomethyltransferase T
VEFCGIENVIISATGYTGSGGFENCKNSEVEQVWNKVLKRVRLLVSTNWSCVTRCDWKWVSVCTE